MDLVPRVRAVAVGTCLLLAIGSGSAGIAAPKAGVGAGSSDPPGPLLAIDARASDDVWAVGYQFDPHDPDDAITLTEHWDGTAWTLIPSPGGGSLTDVSALARDDVWAVGTVALHWNGSLWTTVPMPVPPGATGVFVTGVEAVSPNDVWAVGQFELPGYGNDQMLIEHWNGSRWQVVRAPDVVGTDRLFDVAAVSSNDVWAVGSQGAATLTVHWNGSAWAVVPTPDVGPAANALQDVSAVSGSDVWAVGAVEEGLPYKGKTLTEHWDGTRWSRVPSPNKVSADHLAGVIALSAGDVWTVGSFWPDAWTVDALTLHFNGVRWGIVAAPPVSLNDVSGVSADDVWAVSSIIEHWDGVRWRVVSGSQ
jgi:hypothetical protein